MRWMLVAAGVLLALWGLPAAAAPNVVAEEFQVEAKDDGILLHIRNKHPEDYYDAKPGRTVLFVHGATFPGAATFDLALDGTSWMDFLARRGYDVYALDIRGYGKSTRPPEMNGAAEAHGPAVDGMVALRDVSKAVDFVLSRRGVERLVLVGWSWGATLAGRYASEASNRVERLVLYAPQWLRDDVAAADAPKLGAWRAVKLDGLRERWLREVPEKERRDLIPQGWMTAWLAALGTRAEDGALKVPNGAVADTLASWAAGKPWWNPERVSAPTLVVQGEWDMETPPAMGLSVFARLTGAPVRRYVMIGEATHTLLLEKNRHHLFRAVHGFLEESFAP
ncbi:alpha/beta hydrolase [Magnetospirillum sp. UT-4]|uniref:alpha/beta hydrolase n=1 Tax=Magnetospirillum sp. UT-4 TaxID=2681467 RepID=UPI001573A76B|nr:alpha/beta fold hydrolase [Magnetospirillum sp. UT-4]